MSKIYDDGTFRRYETTAPTKPIVEMSREEENCFSQQNQVEMEVSKWTPTYPRETERTSP